jgi:nitric oxide reductase NorQ protein
MDLDNETHTSVSPAGERGKRTPGLAFSSGESIVVHWEGNFKSTMPNAVKANKTDRGKTKKIILCDPNYRGVHPRPGEVWLCRVVRTTSKADNRGAIFVQPVTRKIEYQFAGVWIDPVKAQLIATVLQDPRRNLMMEGDQGVGKSTIAAAIAKTLGWEYRKISGGLIKKFVFMLGRFVPTSDDGVGLSFKWADSKLVEVLREANENPHKTFLLMIDEFTRIDEDARDALLDVIEGNQRVLRLPTGDEVAVGRNVVFMAAGNVGEGFTIRREDAAAKDRWVIVKITVMPQPEELAHCMRLYPACPKDQLDRGLTIINKVRQARKDPKMRLSKTVSTRGAETLAMFLAAGHGLEVSLLTAVVNQYQGSVDDTTSEAHHVHRLIKEELEK